MKDISVEYSKISATQIRVHAKMMANVYHILTVMNASAHRVRTANTFNQVLYLVTLFIKFPLHSDESCYI